MSDRPEPGLAATVEGRRALRWVRVVSVLAAVYVVVVVTVTAVLLTVELRRVGEATTDRHVVEHRMRNEESHRAQCEILLATAELLADRAGLDSGGLPECPPAATFEDSDR